MTNKQIITFTEQYLKQFIAEKNELRSVEKSYRQNVYKSDVFNVYV